jgi:hypothetical protein
MKSRMMLFIACWIVERCPELRARWWSQVPVLIERGAGPMAYEARVLLDKYHTVTEISNVESFHFVPSNPWAAVGWRKRTDGATQRHLG